MDTAIVKVRGRKIIGNPILVGLSGDNNVFRIAFSGLPEYPNMVATLFWGATNDDESGGDAIILERVPEGWAFVITDNMTQFGPYLHAYIRIDADGDLVWHSYEFRFCVSRLPDLPSEIVKAYPSAVDQMLVLAQGIKGMRFTIVGEHLWGHLPWMDPPDVDLGNVVIGVPGPVGPQGEQGIQGPKGDKGDKGDTGSVGPRGEPGVRGDTGAQGIQGEKGDKGDTGATGPIGIQGPQGVPGVTDIATMMSPGLMSSADKTKLDGLPDEIAAEDVSAIGGGTGGIVTLHKTVGGLTMPVKVRNEVTQDGVPSPDNRVGFTGEIEQVALKARGKNWWKSLEQVVTSNGITCTPQTDGSVILNGTAATTGVPINILGALNTTAEVIPGSSGQTYTVSGGHDGVVIRVQQYDGSAVNNCDSRDGNKYTFTVPPNRVITRLVIQVLANVTVNNVRIYPQLELGDTATAFEPHTGKDYTYTPTYPLRGLPGARDDVDLATGVETYRTVTRTYDGSEDELWSLSGVVNADGTRRFFMRLPDKRMQNSDPFKCTYFNQVVGEGNAAYGKVWGATVDASTTPVQAIYFAPDISITTTAQWRTWLAANPIEIEYRLADPLIIQGTPLDMQSIDGTMNIWANTTSVEVDRVTLADVVTDIYAKLAMIGT